jgi:hypothetical protein
MVLITNFKVKECLAMVQEIGQTGMASGEIRIHFPLD